jgi:Flp pilus assembly secretin CpaC
MLYGLTASLALSTLAAAPPTGNDWLRVLYSVHVMQCDAQGRAETLSRPFLAAFPGQHASVAVGQEIVVNGQNEQVGVVVNLWGEPAAKGMIELRIEAEVRELARGAIQVRKVRASRLTRPDVPVRLGIEGGRWVTVKARVILPPPGGEVPGHIE